ncbi:hypothetical protein SDC9_122902 [bioreactor metagenome]|uniref:Uncharacterized protein n=1 Tax=bioreactor metagenome TaxID=1076179 RepID=A0A645CG29_9ZZZZ
MDGAKRVGHVQLRHGGQVLCKLRVVFRLPRLKPGVFQQQNLAGLQRFGLRLRVGTHGVGGKNHFPAQKLPQPLCHGGQTQLHFPLSLGLPHVGAGDDRRAVFQQILNGGQRRRDALVAGNGAGGFVQRHVKIAPQQDLFACYVHVPDGFLVVVHKASSLSMSARPTGGAQGRAVPQAARVRRPRSD